MENQTRVQFSVKSRQAQAVLAVVGLLLLRLCLLSTYPLMDKTESRYAEIPREMLSIGDWVTPRLDPELPFLGKPPLAFWSTLPSYTLLGVNEFSARLPSFIFALGTLLSIYFLGKSAFNPNTVLLANLILVSTALFYVLAGFVSTDSALGFCTTASLSGFAISVFGEEKQRRLGSLNFFTWLGFSLLAKGLVGPILILLPVLLWSLLTGNWKWCFRKTQMLLGVAVAIVISVPWHVLAETRTHGFLYYYFIGEHLQRFLVSGWTGNLYGKSHSAPVATIWIYLALALCPWLIPVVWRLRSERIFALIKHCYSDQRLLFVGLWFVIPPLFFTFSGNILMPYIYPSLPAFALLAAWYLEKSDNQSLFPSEKKPALLHFSHGEQLYGYLHRWIFRLCCVVAPFVLLIAAFTVLPAVAQRRSQKNLIHAYQDANYLLPGRLNYLSTKPYSADFYLGQTALDLSLQPNVMKERISDSEFDYYVTTKGDYQRLELELPQLHKLATFGDFILSTEDRSLSALNSGVE
jgi:4-amino-4-deoxy-L-arabinose transferase-like glycosyltransferase